jgi:hypothetical protein
MPLNYFGGQAPPAHNTSMTLHVRAHTHLYYPAYVGHTQYG